MQVGSDQVIQTEYVAKGTVLFSNEKIKLKKEGKKMALKLELNSTIIPIEIGEFKFDMDMTDTKRRMMEEKFILFTEEVAGMMENNPEDEAKAKEILEMMYDELLGVGTFSKLYAHTESLEILSNVLVHLIAGIKHSLQERVVYNPKLQLIKENKKTSKKKAKQGGE